MGLPHQAAPHSRSEGLAGEPSRQGEKANRIYKKPRCHGGNYGMPALLMGARAEEKAFAQGRPQSGPRCATPRVEELEGLV